MGYDFELITRVCKTFRWELFIVVRVYFVTLSIDHLFGILHRKLRFLFRHVLILDFLKKLEENTIHSKSSKSNAWQMSAMQRETGRLTL